MTRGGNPLYGTHTYKVTLPPNIPAAKFRSFTVHDNQSRSMLQTAQRFPRAGSQSFRRRQFDRHLFQPEPP
jgi:hypothetical protein